MRASTRWATWQTVTRVPFMLSLPVLIIVAAVMFGRLAIRWFSGAPMWGRRTSNATFWAPATEVMKKRIPGWFEIGLLDKWGQLPGWHRAIVRSVITLLALGLFTFPRTTWLLILALAIAAAVRGAMMWWEWRKMREHVKAVVGPLYATLAQYLTTSKDAKPATWVSVPTDYLDNPDAVIRVFFPVGFDPVPKTIASIKGVMARHIGRQFDLVRTTTEYAEWRRVPPLPRMVPYRAVVNSLPNLSPYKIPMGVVSHDRIPLIDLTTDSPHYFVVGSGGAGKTSHLRIPITHVRTVGQWLVDIIDMKQQSFYRAYDATEEAPAVPGIRIHTDTQSSVRAVAEFFVSMFGANLNKGADRIPRVLVFDEFGSFVSFVKFWWRSLNMPGTMPPIMAIMEIIAFQGRQADHRIIIGVHDFDRQLFGSVGFRNMFDYRAYLGPNNLSRYRTTFGAAPLVKHNAEITGRGLLALGEDTPDEIQFAYVSEDEARELTQNLDAPEWFTRRQLPPWVTNDAIAKAEETLGTIRKKGSKEDLSLLGVLLGGHMPLPAETPSYVPGQRQGDTPNRDTTGTPPPAPAASPRVAEESAEPAEETRPKMEAETASKPPAISSHPADEYEDDDQDDEDVQDGNDDEESDDSNGAMGTFTPAELPRLRLVSPTEEPVIVGMQAAVEYLNSAGWPKVGTASFVKARQRYRKERREAGLPVELPGETKGPGGQPQFTPSGLRQWQSRRDRVGRQEFGN